MAVNVTYDKAYSFSIKIVNLYRIIRSRNEYDMSRQCLRSGTAIGALVSEAKFAQSELDFLNKMYIALKEANETCYWLSLMKDTNTISEDEYNNIAPDAIELVKMLSSTTKTTREKIEKQKNAKKQGNDQTSNS